MGTEDLPQMMEVHAMNGGLMSVDKAVDLACFIGGRTSKQQGTSSVAVGGGGGRRKQSKPIRVFADGEAESVGAAAPLNLPEHDVSDHGPDDGRSREDFSIGLEADAGILIPCDMCQDTFRTEAKLSDHVLAIHNAGEDRTRDSSFLTKYHQLGSELNGSMMIEGANEPDEGYADGGPMNYDSSTPPHVVQGLPSHREDSQLRESPQQLDRTSSKDAFDRDRFLGKDVPFSQPYHLMDLLNHNGHSRHTSSPPTMVPSPLRENDSMFPKKMESHPSPTSTANHIVSNQVNK